ncbi:MAG: transposase [Nitrososphaerota archaeon]|nr:transposase [Nitrososphaerota archaeon]MDG6990414.1 transposase [Nitrososphaerota archaeon]
MSGDEEESVPILTVVQAYSPDIKVQRLMQQFRGMVNYIIRAGVRSGKTDRREFGEERRYLRSAYRLESSLVQSAIGHAAGILKLRKEALKAGQEVKEPYCRRLFLKASDGVRIREGILDMPECMRVPLTERTLEVIGSHEVKQVTLTANKCCISYSLEPEPIPTYGVLALDLNLRNVTMADTKGSIIRLDIARLADIPMTYRDVQSRFTRNDNRIREELYQKYGDLERRRVNSELHKLTHAVVEYAAENNFAIAVEDLNGLRERFTRESGKTERYRAMMNHWRYGEILRQIAYKSECEGVELIQLNSHETAGTSSRCSSCGCDFLVEESYRTLKCLKCELVIDRDENAAKNILAGALRHRAVGRPEEAMREHESASSKVDGRQVRHG